MIQIVCTGNSGIAMDGAGVRSDAEADPSLCEI